MPERIRIGDVTIDRIVEQERAFLPALDMFPTLTPEQLEENRSWLKPDAIDETNNLRLAFQSFVVRTPNHTILIDSCIGNDKPRPQRPFWHMKTDDRWMNGLAAIGLGVEQIDYVLCTHLHVDHVGWNTCLAEGRWVPTFPNARYVFEKTEYTYWEAEHSKLDIPVFADSVLPVVQAGRAELVSADHGIGDFVRLLPTPGHTPGHVSVEIGKGSAAAVVSGDALHSPLQTRYPELSPRFDVDPAQAARSRRGFLERFAETGTVCCMSHFPSPSTGRIRRWGDGFRCEPL